jgi:hypothetical protein
MLSYNIYSNRSGILGIHERHESINGVICVIMRFNLYEEERNCIYSSNFRITIAVLYLNIIEYQYFQL